MEEEHYKGTEFYKEFADKTNNAPGSTKVAEEELKCPKLSNGEICQAHKSERDLRFVSYMCPLIATPKHCTNPEHSELDHEPKHCEDPGHTHEPEGKVVNFLTRLRHVGTDESEKEEMKNLRMKDIVRK